MAAKKFRWSVDGGASWAYEEAELPFTLSGVSAADTVIVEAIGTGVEIAPQGTQTETHVFILAGQSNMVGRPAFDGGAGYPAGTLQVARAGTWSGGADGALVAAASPLDHWDAQAGDMGLALQFVIDYVAANPAVTVVLIPAAKGGTSFGANEWGVGTTLSNDLIARANALFAANPSFVLRGILWHQGESDADDGNTVDYPADLDAQFAEFRAAISVASATTPIVLGELGRFAAASGNRLIIQNFIRDTVNRVPYTALVSSLDLTDQGDNLHFDAASLRIFGTRYQAALSVAVANAPAVPAQVTGLAAVAGDGQVTLSWAAPAYNRSPITDYRIEVSTNAGTSWSVVADGVSTATGYVHAGLTNGTAYLYRVSAINAVGTGASSATAGATPVAAGGAVAVLAYDSAYDTSDLTSYSFSVDLGAGDVIVGIANRSSIGNGNYPSAVTVDGGSATLVAAHAISTIQYHSFWRISSTTARTATVVVTLPTVQLRAGVHVWTLGGADVTSITDTFSANPVSSVTIDVAAGGCLLALESAISAGVTGREPWANYGDTFGVATADLAVTAAETGHAVSATLGGTTTNSGLSVLFVPVP